MYSRKDKEDTKMYTTSTLKFMPYAQATVRRYDNGDIYMISYRTVVIRLSADGWLTCTGTYSRTTIRHIGAFMKEFVSLPNGECGSYYMAKDAYHGGYSINIHTGEVRPLQGE